MGLLKEHLIGVREQLEKQYDRSFTKCEKCNDKGFLEIEIMGDGANFEYDVIDTKIVSCDECF